MTAHVADDQIPSAVRRLARALGAEMFGVDLAERLDGPTARAVRTRLLEHVVIFLHDQQLAPPQRWRWPRASEVDAYPLVKGLPEGALALPIIGGRTTGSTSAPSGIRTPPISSASRTQQGWPPGPQPSRPPTLADAEVPHLE